MDDARATRWKIAALVAAIGVSAALPFACDNRPEPKPAERTAPSRAEPERAPAPSATDSGGARLAPPGDIHWTKPSAWQDAPSPSPMRKATYRIGRAPGDPEDAELTVVVAGGSTDDNISRWEGQLGGAKAKVSQKNPHGLAATIVEIAGDYAGGGPMMGGGGEKKSGWMMLAAVVDAGGGEHYFFKLTGPKKTVAAARKDFDALLDSISK